MATGLNALDEMGNILGACYEAAATAAHDAGAKAVKGDEGGHVSVAKESARVLGDELLKAVHLSPLVARAMALEATAWIALASIENLEPWMAEMLRIPSARR
jgi:hypothetical protein